MDSLANNEIHSRCAFCFISKGIAIFAHIDYYCEFLMTRSMRCMRKHIRINIKQ